MKPYGTTRTAVRRDHALIAPDSHVQAALPGWKGTKGIILISPRMGAKLTQYYAVMERGGESGPAAAGVQRLGYVMEGTIALSIAGAKHTLSSGGYFYAPAGCEHRFTAKKAAKVLFFEKKFQSLDGVEPPAPVVGDASSLPETPFMGDERAQLKFLLPDHPSYDMAVNIFTYLPGATLPFVETHIMEHGLLMLQGEGVYRLADSWYPVEGGDVIWMAPYCPQWFVAHGRQPAAYIYYKDVNRDPMQEG